MTADDLAYRASESGERRPQPRGRAVGWLVANALLWSLFGSAGTLLWTRRATERTSLGDLADQAAARLQGLDLTAAQQEELTRVRATWREEVVAREQQWLRDLDGLAAAADAKVAALLTTDQARRYQGLALGIESK